MRKSRLPEELRGGDMTSRVLPEDIKTSSNAIAEAPRHIFHLRPEALAKFLDTILAAPLLILEPTILGGMTTSQVTLVAETPLISHLMPDGLAEFSRTMAAAPPLIIHLRPEALAKFSGPTSVMIPPHFLNIRIPTTLNTFGLLQLHF